MMFSDFKSCGNLGKIKSQICILLYYHLLLQTPQSAPGLFSTYYKMFSEELYEGGGKEWSVITKSILCSLEPLSSEVWVSITSFQIDTRCKS